jgi:uncharacterized repeat protein (TIGR03803 family)
MVNLSWWNKSCTLVLLCAATAIASPAQTTFTTLVDFDLTNGESPYGSLVQGQDGNLYGTTGGGGLYNSGEVFKITPAGALTTLYSFSKRYDGVDPLAPLMLATNGNFYGTTSGGGRDDNGAVFRITPSGAFRVVDSFDSTDGSYPQASLVQATDESLYGTTAIGGANNYGAVFKVTPERTLITLYSFCSQSGCTDGANPQAGLVQAADGNLYGTTAHGGANEPLCLGQGCGTLFKITTTGQLTTLYRFGQYPDGNYPYGGLIQATDGHFYGTTFNGGVSRVGTVFKMTPQGKLTTLYSFCSQSSCTDGAAPYAALIQATDGNFYGTTAGRGTYGDYGTLFRITPGGTLTTLYSFCAQASCADGVSPLAGLLQATNGTFYGTTLDGGGASECDPIFYGCGTVFSLDVGLGPFVAFVLAAGKVGQTGGILGQGLTGTTSVSLNGIPASFSVVSDTFIRATVPAGATTGYVTVTTPTGTLTSNVPFHVLK